MYRKSCQNEPSNSILQAATQFKHCLPIKPWPLTFSRQKWKESIFSAIYMKRHFQPLTSPDLSIKDKSGDVKMSFFQPLLCRPPFSAHIILVFPNTLIISVNLPLSPAAGQWLTTLAVSQTYHPAGNTQARKWLTWNGNVSHSVGAGSWSEILAVGEMADDNRIPLWAGIVEVRVPLRFFLRGGDTKIQFPLGERFTKALYTSYFFAYSFIHSIFSTSLLVDFHNYWHHLHL